MTQQEFHDRYCRDCEHSYHLPGHIYKQCGVGVENCPYLGYEEDENENE